MRDRAEDDSWESTEIRPWKWKLCDMMGTKGDFDKVGEQTK